MRVRWRERRCLGAGYSVNEFRSRTGWLGHLQQGEPSARGDSLVKASSPALIWGSTPDERELPFACDRHLTDPDSICWRAVDIEARASVVFRWLCQLRVAPYSYDLLDNLGRRSPQTLTEGLDQLELGQRFMTMFELVEFERDRHVTLLADRFQWLFGEWAISYMVLPAEGGGCRLLVKLLGRYRYGRIGRLLGTPTMPWLDLFMMRRQLLNLKGLAERDAKMET
jgi:hypothetical protein